MDRVIRTNRKTVALIIEEDGSLVVRAPIRTSGKVIQEIVRQKTEWIRTRQALAHERNSRISPPRFQPGESFRYLGCLYKLVWVDSPPAPLHLNGTFQLDRALVEQGATLFKNWYRHQASRIIPLRVEHFAPNCDGHFENIRIKDNRTRWGSCGKGNSLNFNWRLVMAPLDVIDYVVVHELAHLTEKNHSH